MGAGYYYSQNTTNLQGKFSTRISSNDSKEKFSTKTSTNASTATSEKTVDSGKTADFMEITSSDCTGTLDYDTATGLNLGDIDFDTLSRLVNRDLYTSAATGGNICKYKITLGDSSSSAFNTYTVINGESTKMSFGSTTSLWSHATIDPVLKVGRIIFADNTNSYYLDTGELDHVKVEVSINN